MQARVAPAWAQAEIQRLKEEWGFQDEATAEAFLRSKQKQLRHRAASRKQSLLQVCNLQALPEHAALHLVTWVAAHASRTIHAWRAAGSHCAAGAPERRKW